MRDTPRAPTRMPLTALHRLSRRCLPRSRAVLVVVSLLSMPSIAWGTPPDAASPSATVTARDRLGYAIGMDVAFSVAQASGDIDRATFKRALQAALAGQPSPLADADVPEVAKALLTRLEIRRGRIDAPMPPLSPVKAAQLLARQVGGKLRPVADQFDQASMLAAIDDVLDGRVPRLTPSDASETLKAFAAERSAAQARQDAGEAATRLAEAERFLQRNARAPGVHVTPSGLQYKVLRQGPGRPIGLDRPVRVNYAGRFADGQVFDSSYARNEPVVVTPRGAIPGFAEGLAKMPVGGKYRLWIPPALGYGTVGTPGGPIPPNSLLVFDVEVLGEAVP